MVSGRMADLMEIGSELVGGFARDGVDGDGGANGVCAAAPTAVATDIRSGSGSGSGEGPGIAQALLPIPASSRLWRRMPSGE